MMEIEKDYMKVVSILEHSKNEKQHLDAIKECILIFNEKWLGESESTKSLLEVTGYTLTLLSKFEHLKTKLYGDHKAKF